MQTKYLIKSLSKEDFDGVIKLGNEIHGEGYLCPQSLELIYKKGLFHNLNASFVAYDQEKLIGFRLTYAPSNWEMDQWCTPTEWPCDPSQVAYFKCNTIDQQYQGQGIGGQLLNQSVTVLRQMGAKAGLSHIWMQSAGNASYKYFTKAGGVLIKTHPRRWHFDESLPDYVCILCGHDCHCDASEMILEF